MRSTYKDRDTILQEMGFKSYQEYLASDLWNIIKSVILKRDKGQCRLCSAKTRTVHHISHSLNTFLGKSCGMLVAICPSCRASCEVGKEGRKLSTREVHKSIIERLSGLEFVRGRSNSTIGMWYKKRFQLNTNRSLNTVNRVKKEAPEIYQRLLPFYTKRPNQSKGASNHVSNS